MSHVVIGGDEHKAARLRYLLGRWGVTVGCLWSTDDGPTVQECDAVVVQGGAEEMRGAGRGALPDGTGGAAGPAAPLIFINDDELPLVALPASWLVLPRLDADGANLRVVLVSAFAHARALRGDQVGPARGPDADADDSFLHFLGHELRSPLTAIKTSLEVLEGELGGMEADDSAAKPGLRMLAIALRNVRRLHRTVEWSQDLWAAGEMSRATCLREIEAREIAARLRTLGPVDTDCGDHTLHLDPEVLQLVAGQMARALGMAAPEAPVTLRLTEDAARPDRFHLVVAALDGEEAVPAAGAAQAGAGEELQRLAGFMVSARLVAALGATLVATETAGGRPILTLTLSQQPAEALLASS